MTLGLLANFLGDESALVGDKFDATDMVFESLFLI